MGDIAGLDYRDAALEAVGVPRFGFKVGAALHRRVRVGSDALARDALDGQRRDQVGTAGARAAAGARHEVAGTAGGEVTRTGLHPVFGFLDRVRLHYETSLLRLAHMARTLRSGRPVRSAALISSAMVFSSSWVVAASILAYQSAAGSGPVAAA